MPGPRKLALFTAFAALYLIWGSTYLAIRFAIETIPPFLMAGTRFLLAGFIMYGIAFAQGAPRSSGREWKTALIVGGCLLLGGNGGVTFAEQYVSSGLASVMVATVPIYIALLGWAMGMAARPRPIVWLGLAGGFLGVAILVGPALNFAPGARAHPEVGMLILLCSSFLWSAGSLYSRVAKNASSPFLATAQQMLCGGTLLILAGLLTGEPRRLRLHNITWLSFNAFTYLVLIGAIVGYTAYTWLLRHCDPAKVATYAYVNPIVAVLLGSAFAHETLSARAIIAAGLIIGSVALVITVQQSQAKTAAALPLVGQVDRA
ncbi:MAG: EamA family transporter [Chthoniobacterales bacterium]|nr:EamA family transporter [Chthoniobacterales bacterium]